MLLASEMGLKEMIDLTELFCNKTSTDSLYLTSMNYCAQLNNTDFP